MIDDCIRRIATRLCQLDDCTSQETIAQDAGCEKACCGESQKAKIETSCCAPGATASNNAKTTGADQCCSTSGDNVGQIKSCDFPKTTKLSGCAGIAKGGSKCGTAAEVVKEPVMPGTCCTSEKAVSCSPNGSACSALPAAIVHENQQPAGCCTGSASAPKIEEASSVVSSADSCCKKITTDCEKTATKGDCCSSKPTPKTCGAASSTSTSLKAEVTSGCYSKASDAPKHDSQGNTDSSTTKLQPQGSDQCAEECCKLIEKPTPGTATKVCDSHLKAAFERYESIINRGLCLCRTALEQLHFCCCSGTTVGKGASIEACKSHDWAEEKKSACSNVVEILDEDEIHAACSKDKTKLIPGQSDTDFAGRTSSDVEHDAAREHVVLNVSGMTCTGCVRKLGNVMSSIDGVSSHQVTFVTETAEFDLDTGVVASQDVISRIEKETGFKCSRLISGHQSLDVVMSFNLATSYEACASPGIISVEKLKKQMYRITYDPRIVGARCIIEPGMQLAPPVGDVGVSEGKKRLRKMLIATIVSAVFTIPVVILNWSNNPIPKQTVQIISLVLATVVQAIAVPEFYVGAIKSLVYSRVIEMDMLVVLSITAAYLYSIVAFGLAEAGFELEQEAFFETSSLLITLVLFGRLMAAYARVKAVTAVSTRSLQADTAQLVEKDNTVIVDARLLHFGDMVKIGPHSRIVTDGLIHSGDSAVDESIITGESAPVTKSSGDSVIAGSMNGSGTLTVKVTRLPGENSITDIANLVENALAAKPRIQDLADKVASWFIPAVVGIAIVVFAIWIGVALEIRNDDAGGAVGTAITYAIAVLAISCPCALGLAVPVVLVIAGGVSARAGVIIKASDALERSFKATDIVFDKTGTLTTGKLSVVKSETFATKLDDATTTGVLRAVLDGSQHPVAEAVAAYTDSLPISKASLEQIQSVPGSGVQALWNGSSVKAGNPFWLNLEQDEVVADLLARAMTVLCLTIDDRLIAVFGLKSTLREEAHSVVAKLQAQDLTCHVVSGDNPKSVADVAGAVGIEASCIVSRASPAKKQQYIENLQQAGKTVLFCGDGTNDAIAVAQADIGVQIGTASDLTGAAADVVLLGGLDGIISLLDTSKKAFRRIQFNFIWTAVYNLFAILLAAGAFVKFRIPPAYAGLGEIASVGPVILAAASLAWRRG